MQRNNISKYYREHGGKTHGVSYDCFLLRIKSGRDRDEAIRIPPRGIHKAKPQKRNKPIPLNSCIDITYNEEEASIFIQAYENTIKDLERKFEESELPQDAHDIGEKLFSVIKEFEIFLLHNKNEDVAKRYKKLFNARKDKEFNEK